MSICSIVWYLVSARSAFVDPFCCFAQLAVLHLQQIQTVSGHVCHCTLMSISSSHYRSSHIAYPSLLPIFFIHLLIIKHCLFYLHFFVSVLRFFPLLSFSFPHALSSSPLLSFFRHLPLSSVFSPPLPFFPLPSFFFSSPPFSSFPLSLLLSILSYSDYVRSIFGAMNATTIAHTPTIRRQ